MSILSMSVKNLGRYRTRTIITITAVAVSVFISIAVDGFLRGIFDLSTYNLLLYESSEVTVYRNGYFEKKDEYPDDILIEKSEYESLVSALDDTSLRYTPRYKTSVTLLGYDGETGIEMETVSLLVGVDPERDGDVYAVSSGIAEGEWLEKGKDGVVIGSTLADKLAVKTGDYISIEAGGRGGFREVIDEEIIGIVNTENPQVNRTELFMDLSVLDDCLFLDGAVSEIDISDGRTPVASRRLRSHVEKLIGDEPLSAYYYEDVNSDLMAIMNGDKGSSIIVLVFLFIIAAAGISNTMIMAAMERRRESAMMRSLGFSIKSVTARFVTEGALTGAAGSLIGMVLGFIVLYPLSRYGIDISGLISGSMDFGYRVPLVLKAGLFPQSFLVIPLLALVFSALSAYFPVRRCGRVAVAEIFRRA